jgi:Pyrimidine dimer DNA glycosylase
VQTFLPYPDFAGTAAVLDDVRLGKQRVEAYQIVRTLTGVTRGWQHHPAVKMWRGHVDALVDYGVAMCVEWVSRGRADTVHEKLLGHRSPEAAVAPVWLGNAALHASHRSNLLRKDPEWYRRFGWEEPADLPYVWPVRD